MPGQLLNEEPLVVSSSGSCLCCGVDNNLCRCKTRNSEGVVLTDVPVPNSLCVTLTGYNTCRFEPNPNPPSTSTPHKLYGMNTTRLTGLTFNMQRPDPASLRCQMFGIPSPNPLPDVDDCEQGDTTSNLNNFLLACSRFGNSFGVPCGIDIELANDVGGRLNYQGNNVTDYLWTFLLIYGNCCEYTNPDPPLSNRRTIIYCPWLKDDRNNPTGDTVQGVMSGLTCSPFGFTINYYLTGTDPVVGGSEAGGMDCTGVLGPPPPECGMLILTAVFTQGPCGAGGSSVPVAASAAESVGPPCVHRADRKLAGVEVKARGLDGRKDWYRCVKPGFKRFGLPVSECRSCGLTADQKCGSLDRCPGYVPDLDQ